MQCNQARLWSCGPPRVPLTSRLRRPLAAAGSCPPLGPPCVMGHWRGVKSMIEFPRRRHRGVLDYRNCRGFNHVTDTYSIRETCTSLSSMRQTEFPRCSSKSRGMAKGTSARTEPLSCLLACLGVWGRVPWPVGLPPPRSATTLSIPLFLSVSLSRHHLLWSAVLVHLAVASPKCKMLSRVLL